MTPKNRQWKIHVNLATKHAMKGRFRLGKISPSRKETRYAMGERYKRLTHIKDVAQYIKVKIIGKQIFVKIKGTALQGRRGWIEPITKQKAVNLGLYPDRNTYTIKGYELKFGYDSPCMPIDFYLVINK